MGALRIALVMLMLVWLAVFLLAFIDRLRGSSLSFFTGGRYHLPRFPAVPWWQHVLRSLLYVVALLSLVFFCIAIVPPMFIVDLPRRLRDRASAKT
jgi:hypothetical protein